MLVQRIEKTAEGEHRGVRITYAATWRYDSGFVLSAAQAILDSDMKDPRDVKHLICDGEEVTFLAREAGLMLSNLPQIQNCQTLTLSGISRIMEVPVTFTFRAGSETVLLESPAARYFAKYGGHVFDRYLDGIEITAWCAVALKRAAAQNAPADSSSAEGETTA